MCPPPRPRGRAPASIVPRPSHISHSNRTETMRAVLMRTRRGAPSLPTHGCRCPRGRQACKVTPDLLLRLPALSTSTAAIGGVGVRRRMMPLIKLVHPDLFAQYPPDVANTNSKSLKVCSGWRCVLDLKLKSLLSSSVIDQKCRRVEAVEYVLVAPRWLSVDCCPAPSSLYSRE